VHKTDAVCGTADAEEYDKDKTMTKAAECAASIQGAGFTYFQFKAGADGACKGCVKDGQDNGAAAAGANVYQIRPNYPLNLQDPNSTGASDMKG